MAITKNVKKTKTVKKAGTLLSKEIKSKTKKIKNKSNDLISLTFLAVLTFWLLGSSFFYFNPLNNAAYTNENYINFNNVPSDWFNSLKIPEKYKSGIDDNIYELVD